MKIITTREQVQDLQVTALVVILARFRRRRVVLVGATSARVGTRA
jgi:hypothetical protein